MPVYLQGGMVLLDSGFVAIDTGCCCGGCTICPTGIFFGPFDDGAGNCYSVTECDFSLSNPVDCSTLFTTFTATCCDSFPGCCGTSACDGLSQIIDPVTCIIGPTTGDGCGLCGTRLVMSGVITPCFGACCIGGVCSVTTESDCVDAGGTWHIDIGCVPNPC